jgi:protein ImuA
MHQGRKTADLQRLRETLRTLERSEGFRAKTGQAVLPFGLAALDGLWPDGGLPRGALHEVAGEDATPGSFAAATGFAAAIAGRLQAPVLWCARGAELYGPGLASVGLDARRLIVAQARSDKDILAAMEEGLRSGILGAVVGEIERIDLTASRRLQLASEKSATMTLVLRRPGKQSAVSSPITAASRWRVGPSPSQPPGPGPQDFHQVPERARWRLELSRSRFGAHGSWIVEAPDAQGHLHLPALLADRGADTPYTARVA